MRDVYRIGATIHRLWEASSPEHTGYAMVLYIFQVPSRIPYIPHPLLFLAYLIPKILLQMSLSADLLERLDLVALAEIFEVYKRDTTLASLSNLQHVLLAVFEIIGVTCTVR